MLWTGRLQNEEAGMGILIMCFTSDTCSQIWDHKIWHTNKLCFLSNTVFFYKRFVYIYNGLYQITFALYEYCSGNIHDVQDIDCSVFNEFTYLWQRLWFHKIHHCFRWATITYCSVPVNIYNSRRRPGQCSVAGDIPHTNIRLSLMLRCRTVVVEIQWLRKYWTVIEIVIFLLLLLSYCHDHHINYCHWFCDYHWSCGCGGRCGCYISMV